MDGAARDALVDSLLRELIVGTSRMQMERTDRAGKELVSLGAVAVPALIETGHSGDGILRQQVARLLAFIGEPAVDPLIASLESRPESRFRRFEAEALGEIGDPRAYPSLERMLLEEDDWAVRGAAARALGVLGDPRASGPLARALDREADPFVRGEVVVALGSFRDGQSVEALIGAMARAAASDEVDALAVVRACGRSLRRITGESIEDDPRAWRDWWARRAGSRAKRRDG
jgi:HEAT repeat protein